MKPKKLDDDEINGIVRSAIREAVDFVESEISPARIKAQRYWRGESDLAHEEGRSKVVATKVRDVIRTLKPALMRVFFQADHPVEFIPQGPEDVESAEQATSYAAWKFSQCDGYKKMQGAFHDALLKKNGILKIYFDESEEVDFEEYTGLTDEQFAMLAADDEMEIIEHSERPDTITGPMGEVVQIMLHDVKASFVKTKGSIKVESVPPEDFFTDRSATSPHPDDFFVMGHSTEKRVGDMVNMGFDFEEVVKLSGPGDESDISEEEDYERAGYDRYSDDQYTDPSMRPILVTEAYMRMDIEGAGVPKLYRFICGGTNHKVLDYEIADEVPFAVFECEPEPHTFFANSVADLVINEQDTATSLLRGLIDNVAMVNTPRTLYRTGAVPIEDLLNNEVGGLVGCKDPMTDVREIVVPPTAGAVLPAMQYFDDIVDSKTGVSRAGMGMDTDALQATTVAGVNAAVQAASAAAELIARNLAEGGARQVFRLIARLAAKHIEPGEMMRLNGSFVPVDPRAWSTDMDLAVNVGLGTGAADVRLNALREHHAWQLQVWQQYGPMNGLVSMVQIRETRAEILRLSGIHNIEKHLKPMDEQIEAQIAADAQAQAAQAQQQGGGDPQAQAFMQVEGQKAQARMQTDMMETQRKAQEGQAKLSLEAQKMLREDDRKRDEMEQERALQAAKLQGEYGLKVNEQAIKAEQARERQQMGVNTQAMRDGMANQRTPQG